MKKGIKFKKVLLVSLVIGTTIAGIFINGSVEANDNVNHLNDLVELNRPGSGGNLITAGNFSDTNAWVKKNADIQDIGGTKMGHLITGVSDGSIKQTITVEKNTVYKVTYKAYLSENGAGINCDIRVNGGSMLNGTWTAISGSQLKAYEFTFNSGNNTRLDVEFVKWGESAEIMATEAWISDVKVSVPGGSEDQEDEKYKFIWADDFNEGKLNEDNWGYELGSIRGYEQQHYVKSDKNVYIDSSDNGNANDGKLVIKATDRAVEDQYNNPRNNSRKVIYDSGSIRTHGKQEFLYGRIETKAKLPKGQGVFPAFWTLGSDFSLDGHIASDQGYGWPRCGEIDIMELTGQANDGSSGNRTVYQTLHYGVEGNDSGKYAGNGTAYSIGSGNFNDEYHIFGMNWTKGKIEWYVDNTIVRTVDYSDDPYAMMCLDKPQYIQFNLAMGGDWPGIVGTNLAGTTFDIDYVYYARNDQQQKDANQYYASVPEIEGVNDIVMQQGTKPDLLKGMTTKADYYLDYSIDDEFMFKNAGGNTSVNLLSTGKKDIERLSQIPVGTYNLYITAIPKYAKPDSIESGQLDRTAPYILNRKTVKLTVVDTDKTVLKEKISDAEELLLKTDVYTSKTLDYLNKSVAWAKEINNDKSANDKYVKTAIELLEDSIARLKQK